MFIYMDIINKQCYMDELAKSRAMWVGMATHLANSSESFPYRDSEAARWKAKAAQRRKADAKNGIDGRRRRNGALGALERTPLQGGHQLVKAETGHGWLCATCRMRSVNKKRLSVRRCPGAKKSAISCSPESSPLEGKPHSLRMSGSIIWCGVCGSFTESRVSRLKSMCRGPPPQSLGTGGVRAQLQRLRAGIHPVTMQGLPQTKWLDGTPVRNDAGYLRRTGQEEVDEGFIKYIPADRPALTPLSSSDTAAAKLRQRLMLGRIRMKAGSKARADRKRRKARSSEDALWLIRVFERNLEGDLDADGGVFDHPVLPHLEVVVPGQCTKCNDDSDEEFWNHLPVSDDRREWMQRVPNLPKDGMTLKPRRHQPIERRKTKPGRRCMVLTCYDFGCDGEHTS